MSRDKINLHGLSLLSAYFIREVKHRAGEIPTLTKLHLGLTCNAAVLCWHRRSRAVQIGGLKSSRFSNAFPRLCACLLPSKTPVLAVCMIEHAKKLADAAEQTDTCLEAQSPSRIAWAGKLNIWRSHGISSIFADASVVVTKV